MVGLAARDFTNAWCLAAAIDSVSDTLSRQGALEAKLSAAGGKAKDRASAESDTLPDANATLAYARGIAMDIAHASARELSHAVKRDNVGRSEVGSYDRAHREQELRASASTNPVAHEEMVRTMGAKYAASKSARDRAGHN